LAKIWKKSKVAHFLAHPVEAVEIIRSAMGVCYLCIQRCFWAIFLTIVTNQRYIWCPWTTSDVYC